VERVRFQMGPYRSNGAAQQTHAISPHPKWPGNPDSLRSFVAKISGADQMLQVVTPLFRVMLRVGVQKAPMFMGMLRV